MIIGFDAKRLFHNATGLGNYSRTLVRNLQQWHPRHSYHLFAPKVSKEISGKYPYFSQKKFSLTTNHKTPSSIWRSWAMTKEWTDKKIDLFHGLSNELPFATTTTKQIVTIHDLIFKKLPATYPLLDRLVYDKKVRYSCHQADKIVAISEQTKQDLIYYYNIDPAKITVIYQAVDPVFYESLTTTAEEKIQQFNLPNEYILCVGTLESRKNQLSILKAWRLLPTSLQLPVVLVGRGKTYQKTLAAYANKHKIAPIYWLDQVHSTEVLQAIYQKATLFIYPSLYEGFGLPVVEALLSNIPVITSDISSLPEAAGPHSLLIDPLDIEKMAHGITQVLSDEGKRQQMMVQGKRFARNTFHPKRLSDELMDVYRQIVFL